MRCKRNFKINGGETLNRKMSEMQAALERRKQMSDGRLWASRIAKDVYLGRGSDAQNLDKLKGHGITHVLNVADDVPNYYPNEFVYCNLNVADFGAEIGGIGKSFKKAFEFVRNNNISGEIMEEYCSSNDGVDRKNTLLIHCANGSNRSCTMTIALMMELHGWSLKQAHTHVKKCRRSCIPLRDNIEELLKFEKAKFKTNENSMTRKGFH